MADRDAEENFNEAEEDMEREESEASEAESEEDHVEDLEDEAHEEEAEEGEHIDDEGENEREGEDPEESAEHHETIISHEEHTEQLLTEILDEIEDTVGIEIDQSKYLSEEEDDINTGVHEVVSDLETILQNLRNRDQNQVKDEELQEIEDLIEQFKEGMNLEERSDEDTLELEKELSEAEVEEGRALKLIEEAIEEEDKEESEIKYEGKAAEEYQERQASEHLKEEYSELESMKEKNQAMAQEIVAEVNGKIEEMQDAVYEEIRESEDTEQTLEHGVEVLQALNQELAQCEKGSSSAKGQRISRVRNDIQNTIPTAKQKIKRINKLLGNAKSYMENKVANGSKKVYSYAKGQMPSVTARGAAKSSFTASLGLMKVATVFMAITIIVIIATQLGPSFI